MSGWLYFLGYVAVGATQTIALRELLINQLKLNVINKHIILFNLLFFIVFFLLSLFSLKAVSKIQSVVTVFKLLPIIILILFFIFTFYKNPFIGIFQSKSSLMNIKQTLPLAIFGYWGFEGCCSISHLIKGSKKNVGRAVLIGFIVTVLIYSIFHLGLIQIMGSGNLSVFGTPAFARFLPITSTIVFNFLSALISAAILSAYASSIYGGINAQSFLLNSLAKEKLILFSSSIKKINKHNRPIYAIISFIFFEFLFVTLINHKSILIGISNLGMLSAFVLTLMSLTKIQYQRKRWKNIIMPVIGFVSCGILGYYSCKEIGNILYISPFVLAVTIGFVIFKTQAYLKKATT